MTIRQPMSGRRVGNPIRGMLMESIKPPDSLKRHLARRLQLLVFQRNLAGWRFLQPRAQQRSVAFVICSTPRAHSWLAAVTSADASISAELRPGSADDASASRQEPHFSPRRRRQGMVSQLQPSARPTPTRPQARCVLFIPPATSGQPCGRSRSASSDPPSPASRMRRRPLVSGSGRRPCPSSAPLAPACPRSGPAAYRPLGA
jgi:hypothetical protein